MPGPHRVPQARVAVLKGFLPSAAELSPLQVRLKPLTPQTEEEKLEHSIAAERRRMRLVHKDTLKDLLIRSPRETGTVLHSLTLRPPKSPSTRQ